jgi:hypothetical protein
MMHFAVAAGFPPPAGKPYWDALVAGCSSGGAGFDYGSYVVPATSGKIKVLW